MLSAVLVDDERPAIRGLEHLLRKFPEVAVVGMYTDPLAALDDIERLRPGVVFLDINMPQLMGLDVASRILEESPQTDIIFVTAYDRYAVEAFELNALDYLLKPVEPNRLKKTIERLLSKKPAAPQDAARKLKITCLGQFQIAWENKEPVKWRAEKTRELFAFLLHNQGRDLSKEAFLDRLWPDDEPEKAIRQLYNGIYYIRKALADYGVDRSLVCISSNYHLQLGSVYWDVGRLSKLEKKAEAGELAALEEIEALYTGDYLEGDYYSWATIKRERLSKKHQNCLVALARHHLENKHYQKAESRLKKAYFINPYDENITELLLKLYLETGERSKAVQHFTEYAEQLQTELGIMPNGKIMQLAQATS